MTTVGVIGLGDIGRGVAASVARAGFDLVVCDLRPSATEPFAPTATVAASPRELAALADVVVVAVVDDAQVTAVLTDDDGVLGAAPAGSSVLILSTITPTTVDAMVRRARHHGVQVVDCGVTGGPSAAADGELVCMVGGEPGVVDGLRPVLDAIGSLVVHMGPVGTGLQAKLARNIITYGSWYAAYEGQLLAEAAGVELAKLAEVVKTSDKRIGGASTLMFRDTVTPFPADADAGLVGAMQAAAGLAHKDLRAAVELAASLGVELPLAALTEGHADDVFGVRGRGGEGPAA